jgi:hypothetical protein
VKLELPVADIELAALRLLDRDAVKLEEKQPLLVAQELWLPVGQ